MLWIVAAAVAWLALGLGTALIAGCSIRLRDEREALCEAAPAALEMEPEKIAV